MSDIRWKCPIASIEYLYSGGIGYVTDFFEEEKFRQAVMQSNEYGEPICAVLYHDESGQRLLKSCEWMADVDCPAVSIREESTPIVQDKDSTYEIYQIPSTEDCAPYLFLTYAEAKDKLSAKDYVCVYTAPLEPGVLLDDIYDQHNRDDRPAAQTMRSLSMSDVIAVFGKSNTQAFYVDRTGYKEVPEFAKMLDWLKKKAVQKNQTIQKPFMHHDER